MPAPIKFMIFSIWQRKKDHDDECQEKYETDTCLILRLCSKETAKVMTDTFVELLGQTAAAVGALEGGLLRSDERHHRRQGA